MSRSTKPNSLEEEFMAFLRCYRATPHSSTGIPPNELLFRTASTTARMPNNKNFQNIGQELENHAAAKEQMRIQGNHDLKPSSSTLSVGELVLPCQIKTHKDTITYEMEPFTIIKINGNQAVIKRGMSHC